MLGMIMGCLGIGDGGCVPLFIASVVCPIAVTKSCRMTLAEPVSEEGKMEKWQMKDGETLTYSYAKLALILMG